MGYRISPSSEAWAGGVFCVPREAVNKIKLIDSLKLSVLTLALSSAEEITASAIASALKENEYDVAEALEFWVQQGILTDGEPAIQQASDKSTAKPALEDLPMPELNPKKIVDLCRENRDLAVLLQEAQKILGSSLSEVFKEALVNMVIYYGLPVPVVLTLLHYYKDEREKGKALTANRLLNMAKQWAEEDIDNLEKAYAKLQTLEDINELWAFVINECEFEYVKPTALQQKMLIRWRNDFSKEMISFAVNTMKKYNEKDKQSIKEIDNILKDWKRKKCKTIEDVKNYKKPESKSKSGKQAGKLQGKPSFDIASIANDTIMNDDFDV